MMRMSMWLAPLLIVQAVGAAETTVPVDFSGGHRTDP